MLSRRIFNWLFYGHIWIALAAAGLSWLSIQLAFGEQPWASETPVLAFVFFATLAVYTLHRYLSFQRAGVRPTTRRYEIIANHPKVSLCIGLISLLIAGGFMLDSIDRIWRSLLWALPVTVFYLTPPLKGWRRLRDLPYVKVIWVGLAWAIMTVEIPVLMMSGAISESYFLNNRGLYFMVNPGSPQLPYPTELIVRFLFTVSIALLFDFRDVVLDRSQGVKTMANRHPISTKYLVSTICVVCIAFTIFAEGYWCRWGLATAYFSPLIVTWYTKENKSENWYAVVVNGLLLLPPFVYLLVEVLGADAGAGGGL